MIEGTDFSGRVFTSDELEKMSHSELVMAYRNLRRLRDNDGEAYDTLLQEFRIVVADLMKTQSMLRGVNDWLVGNTDNALPYDVFEEIKNYHKEPF